MKRMCFVLVFVLAVSSAFAGLVAQWDFSDGTFDDQVGSNHGAPHGSYSIVASGNANFAHAIQLGATRNVDYFNVGTLASLNTSTNSFTLSYWVNKAAFTNANGYVNTFESKGGGGLGMTSVFRASNISNPSRAYTTVEGYDGADKLMNGGTVADGNWHWLVVQYDGNTDTAHYFEDGHLYDTEIGIFSLADVARNIYFGNGLDGRMGDLRIYDTALSYTLDGGNGIDGGELDLYAAPDPLSLVAQWNFRDGAYEDQVGINDGVPHGNYSIVASGHTSFANAIELGATRNVDYFNVGNLASLNTSTNSFTLSYWVKHAAFTNANGYVNTFESKGAGGLGMTSVLRPSNVSNPNKAYTTVEGHDGTNKLLNGGTVADGNWHWLVIRYDGDTDTVDYFEDGHFYDTETGIFSLVDVARSTYLGNGLDGQMGDIRIYDGALSYTLDGNNDINGGEVLYITESWDIEYTACPADLQLYPRNRNTGTAVVEISGRVTDNMADAILVRVYRDDILQTATTQSLVFANGEAPFSFSPVIVAETNNYGFEVSILEGARETLVKRVADVVAGDVFIIQGQSNADAREYTGSASANEHPFLRTFGQNSDDSVLTAENQKWLLAKGDGSREVVAGVGQWGLRMGRLLVDAYQLPVAVINGAHGGRAIDFFQRNDANSEDLETNYGRLLYRTRLAGVTNAVRSVLWYQGESDNGDGETHEAGFIALYEDWKENYPGLERVYLHQLRVGCSVDKEDVDLRDRQRRLPDTFADMSVMSTTGLNGHEGCHFAYENGYKLIGNHIAALMAVDLYGSSNTANTTAPNIDYAYFSTPAFDEITVVVRQPSDPLGFDAAASADFLLEGSSAAVTNGVISANNTIVLSLSGNASDAAGLTYTGHEFDGAWVTNAGGVGLLTFFNVPVMASADQDGDGLPDTWEERYFGNATNALPVADHDGDGQNNGQEYITGLDPTNSASFFAVNYGPDCVLGWTGASGRVYSVYWSSNLLSGFQCLESNLLWTDPGFVDSSNHNDQQGFYKVDVRMQ